MNTKNENLYNSILEVAKNRRTAKQYDWAKDVDEETLKKIYSFTKTAPSSMGLELTRIVSISRYSEHKKGINDFFESFNQERSYMASNVTLLVTKKAEFLTEDNPILNSRARRNVEFGMNARGLEYKEGAERGYISSAVNSNHANNNHNTEEWLARQAYIQCGYIVLGAATLGVESTIMEGFTESINDYLVEHNIIDKNERVTLAIALGYVDDQNLSTFVGDKQLRIEDDEYVKFH